MSVSPRLLDELVEAVAEGVAARVLAELEARPAADVGEPWRLLDLEKTAARLHRSARTVRKWAKTGVLPHVRLDASAYAFDLEDVKAFARARRISADDGSALADGLQAGWDLARDAGSGDGRRVGNRRVQR